MEAAQQHPWPIILELAENGWRTPDSYRWFESPPDAPGIYLFLRISGLFEPDKRASRVMYVGMSTCIAQRLTGHPIPPQIRLDQSHEMLATWFRRFPANQIRAREREHIRRFKPPFNIIGRAPGDEW